MSADMPRTRLDVKASAGTVAVSGSVPSWMSEQAVVSKIRQIPGVKDVNADIINLPDLGVAEWP